MIEYNRHQELKQYTDEELKQLLKIVDTEKLLLETQILINKHKQ